MHDSRTVANRFLALAREKGDTLTPMQVLKLVYIAHGWKLGLAGDSLISDEVQAWQYGPVIPVLYSAMRKYKDGAVAEPLKSPEGDVLDEREANLVSQVFDLYGHMNGPALSRLTHAKGTPWDLTYKEGSFGLRISNELIQDHYQRLAHERA